jgi:CHASE2 domain-containing sensor protein
VVEVDDDTFNNPPVSGNTPTNRKFLGELAVKAADGDPAVIAFDFRWFVNAGKDQPSDPARAQDNKALLSAIQNVTSKGVPVVITTFMPKDGTGSRQRMRNIYEDSELPPNTFVGQINMPQDLGKIALSVNGWDWRHTSFKEIRSFALQIVDSYESVLGIRVRTTDDRMIKDSIARRDWVYGGFFERTAFPIVSARKLWLGNGDAVRACRHRIVLIGGTWHTTPGTLVDASQTIFGYVPNVYLHANYIEALLDGRFKASVPKWLMFLIDVSISMLIYLSVHSVRQIHKRIGVLLAFFLPLILAYVFSANAGRYLDFVVPLTLCFIDLGRQTVRLAWPQSN